jgi:hypothetical protein
MGIATQPRGRCLFVVYHGVDVLPGVYSGNACEYELDRRSVLRKRVNQHRLLVRVRQQVIPWTGARSRRVDCK